MTKAIATPFQPPREPVQDLRSRKRGSEKGSTISRMPTGLLNQLTEDQIFDLLAYILSGGKAKDAAFEKR